MLLQSYWQLQLLHGDRCLWNLKRMTADELIHDMQQNNMRLGMQGTRSSAGNLEAVARLIHQRDCLAVRFQV